MSFPYLIKLSQFKEHHRLLETEEYVIIFQIATPKRPIKDLEMSYKNYYFKLVATLFYFISRLNFLTI